MQVVRLEQNYARRRHGMSMHSELPIAKDLHPHAHVVFHENAAVTAALVPVTGESVAISERGVDVVAMIHHEAVTHSVETVEQTELFTGAAQAIARREQDALGYRHAHPRVEVSLQNSVIASRLVTLVALRQQSRCRERSRTNRISKRMRERMCDQNQRWISVHNQIECSHRQSDVPRGRKRCDSVADAGGIRVDRITLVGFANAEQRIGNDR